MRRLFPDPADDVDLVEAYAPGVSVDGPFVRLNMISSLDGAISVEGRSGALGGAADHRVFATLRAHADVILVGAGTVRTEGYGKVRLDEEMQRVRMARGQVALPPIAVVSGSLQLDWSSPFFTGPGPRPVVVTSDLMLANKGNTGGDQHGQGNDADSSALKPPPLGNRPVGFGDGSNEADAKQGRPGNG